MIVVIVATLVSITMAQRPGYIAEPTYPKLASRFRNDNEETTAAILNSRLGEVDGTTEKIPVDARGDADLVHRIKEWPRQNIPYWYLNAEHIERQRNPQGVSHQNSQVQQNRIPAENVQRLMEQLPVNSAFRDYYHDLRPRFGVNDVVPIFVRPIRPIETRPFFAGPLP
ncbi:hypothetical protein PPYR_06523 [Photinus pyralis]|uniref:Uncharacterized protein n=1 Tax=Photinus pyralis TaxID=7054 RepID=A0A1Y1LT35_PHOPY|nr:hypothetical protein PPYR_14713 [Photinus pyralis]KAB0800784.1 hypothetical protein PPYR_06523 [Photinus pyralis]